MKPLVLMLCLCAATAMAQTPSAQRRHQTRTDSSIDAQASSALAGMTAFLKTIKTFRITSESSRDEIVDTDMKVQRIASNVMTVRLPDRLQAHVRSDDQDLQLFYNGQTLTVFSREKNYYGSTPVPPTVSRMLDATRARHGIVMPLVDFIQMAAGEDFQQSIIGAGYIGTSRIGGVECDHLAIRQADVDWQVWIEKSQTPLPRRLVITTKTEPTQPQYISTLTWDLSPTIDDTLFTFTPPPNAARIMFARTKDGAQTPARP